MSVLNGVYLAFAAALSTLLVLVSFSSPADPGALDRVLIPAGAVFGAAMVLVQVFTRSRPDYFLSLAGLVVVTWGLVSLLPESLFLVLCLDLVLTLGICLHNPFPINLALASGAHLGVAAILWASLALIGWEPVLILQRQGELLLLVGLAVGFAAGLVRFRERLIDVLQENRRLDGAVDRLARANLQYQKYAQEAEQASAEQERKRITREIHDIVGYTLTNNITMMEAVTDMMNENPFGVAKMVNLARENAQEGLVRIREALYLLRKTETRQASGLPAVYKLMAVYHKGTGVAVEIHFNEVSWDFPDEVDSAFYQVIQEGLINSFRHGKARKVNLFLSRSGSTVELRISDDGVGAEEIREGIGMSGMRERMAAVGGTVAVEPGAGGFTILAQWPRKEE